MRYSLHLLIACFLTINGVYSEYNLRSPVKPNKLLDKRNEVIPDRAIIGGEETIPGRYPYMAGLLTEFSNSNICGGTLIASQWVLSASHCLTPDNIAFVDIGRHDRSNLTESYEMIAVDFVVLHPNFNPFTLENDVMLIRLKTPSKNKPVSLISASDDVPPGSKVTTMGWGVTSTFTYFQPDILMEVEVDMISNEVCNSGYGGEVSDDMICASSEGKDACQGDSGGPLIKKGENSTMDMQVGIVSWGFGCAEPEYPGVYASVASGLEFIENSMSCNMTDIDDDCCQADCVNGNLVCISTSCGTYNCEEFPNDGFDYSNCNVEFPCYIRDSYCDVSGGYNTAECNYDGGDCCEDTCVGGPLYCSCFDCRDPNSEYTNETNIGTLLITYLATISGATFDFIVAIATTSFN